MQVFRRINHHHKKIQTLTKLSKLVIFFYLILICALILLEFTSFLLNLKISNIKYSFRVVGPVSVLICIVLYQLTLHIVVVSDFSLWKYAIYNHTIDLVSEVASENINAVDLSVSFLILLHVICISLRHNLSRLSYQLLMNWTQNKDCHSHQVVGNFAPSAQPPFATETLA